MYVLASHLSVPALTTRQTVRVELRSQSRGNGLGISCGGGSLNPGGESRARSLSAQNSKQQAAAGPDAARIHPSGGNAGGGAAGEHPPHPHHRSAPHSRPQPAAAGAAPGFESARTRRMLYGRRPAGSTRIWLRHSGHARRARAPSPPPATAAGPPTQAPRRPRGARMHDSLGVSTLKRCIFGG
jgi:hypothetical protein